MLPPQLLVMFTSLLLEMKNQDPGVENQFRLLVMLNSHFQRTRDLHMVWKASQSTFLGAARNDLQTRNGFHGHLWCSPVLVLWNSPEIHHPLQKVKDTLAATFLCQPHTSCYVYPPLSLLHLVLIFLLPGFTTLIWKCPFSFLGE